MIVARASTTARARKCSICLSRFIWDFGRLW